MTEAKPVSNLNIVHQNIQGLAGKDLEIELFLRDLKVHVLCLTEHWLKKFEIVHFVNNYTVMSVYVRKSAIHGGSLILVANDVKCKERKDIMSLSVERSVEISCVELERYVIVCVYRPPTGDYSTFESTMEDLLGKLSKINKVPIVCGDFNVNLLEMSSNRSKIINLFKSFNLVHVFNEPTRITANSATCLDNIFCNCELTFKSVIDVLRSDHCGQFISIPFDSAKTNPKIICRPMNNHRIKTFKDNITKKIPTLDLTSDDPNKLYSKFFGSIQAEFENTFKTRTINKSNKLKFSDWATKGIYKSRTKLYELYGQKQFNQNPDFLDYVKKYSKTFKRVCIAAKSLYYSNRIKQSSNIIKTTWSVINDASGKSTRRDDGIKLVINNNTLSDNFEIAQTFNEYFRDIPTLNN